MSKNSPLIDRRAMLGFTAAAVTGALTACTKAAAPTASLAPVRRRFENKVVLITGATSGIGRAAALAFAAQRMYFIHRPRHHQDIGRG